MKEIDNLLELIRKEVEKHKGKDIENVVDVLKNIEELNYIGFHSPKYKDTVSGMPITVNAKDDEKKSFHEFACKDNSFFIHINKLSMRRAYIKSDANLRLIRKEDIEDVIYEVGV